MECRSSNSIYCLSYYFSCLGMYMPSPLRMPVIKWQVVKISRASMTSARKQEHLRGLLK